MTTMNLLIKDLPNRIEHLTFGDLISKKGAKHIILVETIGLQEIVEKCILLTGNLKEQFEAMLFDGKFKLVLPNVKGIRKDKRHHFVLYKDIPMNQKCDVLDFSPTYYIELKGKK